MSEDTKQSLTVTVGDQTFRVRVPPEDVERYRRVERLANESLAQAQRAGVIAGARALAMALFQMALELEDVREAQQQTQESRDRLHQLINRIDQATERGM